MRFGPELVTGTLQLSAKGKKYRDPGSVLWRTDYFQLSANLACTLLHAEEPEMKSAF